MQTHRSIVAAATAAIIAAGLPVAPAGAQPVAEFYKGTTMTVLIGFGVGGGNDSWARALAHHMGRHIPGNPTLVPQNMPGAGGLKVTNYLYNAAPKNGAVFGLVNRGIPLVPLFGGKGVNFDALKMNWIGSPDRDTTVCVARSDSPVQTMNDLRTKELVVGATGSGADTAIYPEFFANLAHMKFKVIKGYKGTRDISLALERGEVGGMCAAFDSVARTALYKEGKLRILFQAAVTRDPHVPDAPLPSAFVTDPADRQALELFLARVEVGRPFVAPPGVSADRVAALRKAFMDTMNDPDFIAETKKMQLHVYAISGEKLTEIIAAIYKTPKDIVQRTAAALGASDAPKAGSKNKR